jgi:hypothetical protein
LRTKNSISPPFDFLQDRGNHFPGNRAVSFTRGNGNRRQPQAIYVYVMIPVLMAYFHADPVRNRIGPRLEPLWQAQTQAVDFYRHTSSGK